MALTENVVRIENSFQYYSHFHYFKKMPSFILSPRLVGTYHYVHAHHCFPYYKDHISFHLYKVVILFPGSNMDFPLDYHLVETLLFIWSQ